MQFLATLNDQAFMQALPITLAHRTDSVTRMDAGTVQNLGLALLVLPALGAAGFFLQSRPILFAALLVGGNGLMIGGAALAAIAARRVRGFTS